MHDEGLSSVIDWRNEDAHGNSLAPRKRERMKRLRTWDERFRTKTHRERNLKQALGEIDRMASALSLPEAVRETASVVYRRALEEDLLPGRSIEAVATASLYAAVRQTDTPRALAEVTGVSRVDPQAVKRAYRYVVRELNLAVDPTGAEEFLPRFATELGVDSATERRARELLATGREQAVHSGKSPVGLAGAALYAAGRLVGDHVTQAEVSDVADVSEVTIRNRYKELLDAADESDPESLHNG
jgi:transcription initiation factor TFIIB